MVKEDVCLAIRKCMSQELFSLTRLVEHVSVEQLSRLCHLIDAPKTHIYVSGVGTSGFIARKMAASLNSIGISASFLHPSDSLHGGIGGISAEPSVILISKSGVTRELVELSKYLLPLDPTLVLITENQDSPLARICDDVISIPRTAEADPLGLIPTSSFIMTLAVCDGIVSGLASIRGTTTEVFHFAHPSGSLGAKLGQRFRDVMSGVEGHPAVVSRQCALKDAIFSMSAGRIGACLVVEHGRLEGIMTDGDLRRLLEKNGIENLRIDAPILDFLPKNEVTHVHPDDLVSVELGKMERSLKKFTVFPVVDCGVVVGIAHLHDILAAPS